MKILFLFISIFFISSPSWSETLTMDDLVERDDLYYKKFTNVPFTGEISGLENGKFKNGKKGGEWLVFHENGQLWTTGNYKDGIKDGLWERYYEDGSLLRTETWKEGKLTKIKYINP